MSISIFSRVRYIGLARTKDGINSGDIGYAIEKYDNGNYEVELSDPDGTTRSQEVIARPDLQLNEQ